MFDIFCHKITFVFQDTQVSVNDLFDLVLAAKGGKTKKELISELNALIEKRKARQATKKATKKEVK